MVISVACGTDGGSTQSPAPLRAAQECRVTSIGSGLEGGFEVVEHREMLGVEGGEFEAVYLGGRRDQVVGQTDRGVRAVVLAAQLSRAMRDHVGFRIAR